jgi:hypothetical protein
MSHLSTDRLAALGDDEPTPAEAAHLAACAECARERAAYRTLVAMAHAERDSIGLPLTRWDSIADALAAEQQPALRPFLTTAQSSSVSRFSRVSRLPMQIAAGLLLAAGGMIAGRVTAGVPAMPATNGLVSAGPQSGAQLVNVALPNADSVFFSSVDEAREAQRQSEAIYQQAAVFLAQHDTASAGDGSPVAYRSRLAALDQVLSTTQEAMRQAPHDPVINGYYLTTLGQREATLRQLNTVMPASLRANSF